MEIAVHSSRLFYAGTRTEVQLGDRVEFRTLFLRRRRLGNVVCIPERTGRELQLLGKVPEDWLIKLDCGVITGWLYSPEDLQPPSRLLLVARACGEPERTSNADVEEGEAREEANASWLALAAPPVLLLFLLLILSAAWVFVRVAA